jgi:hypothetical protein
MDRRRTLWLISLPILAAFASGCSNDPRLAVSGTVNFKGAPLDQGRIEFHPPGNKGNMSGAVIQNGRFDIPQKTGLAPDTYEVRVFSYDVRGAKAPSDIPGEPGESFKERVARKYNLDSKLKAEVKPGNTVFQFSVD